MVHWQGIVIIQKLHPAIALSLVWHLMVKVLYIKIWEDGSCKMFGCISFGRNLKYFLVEAMKHRLAASFLFQTVFERTNNL
jgi:hypothetical protein